MRLGFEAIQYVFKKALTKKGVKGIPTIPGKAYDMRMKQLVDAMADKMRKMGYDINNVTEKQVKGLLDSAEAMEKQKLKNIQSRFFDPSGKMKPEGEDIVKKGLEGLGKKKDPFQGFTPKIVPKDKTLLKDSPEAIAKIKAENKAAAERLRKKKLDEEPDDFASGGIAGPLHLYDGGRIGLKDGKKPKFPMSRRTFIGGILSALAYPFVRGFGKQATTKTAAPVVKEVLERGADGIPSYAWDLINVVKAKGTRDIMEGIYKRNPPSKKYTYKGVEVTEDGLGTTSVRKEQTKTGHWYDEATDDSFVDDYVDREIGFEIKPQYDEMVDPDSGVSWYKNEKGRKVYEQKVPDEYNESTAHMRGDLEGGMDVDIVEEVISDADHLDLKKIADESKDLIIKKAEGGRASYTKGGLAHVLGV